jgi:recombinational DNA repair protein RecT
MQTQTNGGPPARQQLTAAQEFARRVQATALKQLQAILGTEDGKKAAHSITMAMLSAMRTSRDPSAFLEVTEASIADCVATSYETGLHPGGPNPVVYLVPQAPRKGAQPELQWRITHRGLAILAARAGYGVLAVPVSTNDLIEVEFGEVTRHRADPAAWPNSLDEILGCILVVRRISDGVTIARAWMPVQAIIKRKAKGRGGDVWAEWPIEQAQKTVIKWAFARGYVPLDSPEMRAAMEADSRGEVIDTTATTMETTPAGGAGALGGRRETRALPDHGDGRDFSREAEQLGQRERVVVGEAEVIPPRAGGNDDEP